MTIVPIAQYFLEDFFMKKLLTLATGFMLAMSFSVNVFADAEPVGVKRCKAALSDAAYISATKAYDKLVSMQADNGLLYSKIFVLHQSGDLKEEFSETPQYQYISEVVQRIAEANAAAELRCENEVSGANTLNYNSLMALSADLVAAVDGFVTEVFNPLVNPQS
tara:strand:- start:78864 stop:79355 length:492 start_codon:yes stop_codon:yes gene_type:complete